MKTTNQKTRVSKRKTKKKRKFLFFLIPFLLIAGAGAYFIYEYQAGLKLSQSVAAIDEDIEFNGVSDLTGKVNVLLLGVDARENEEVSRTDTIMIAQYDPEQNTTKLVSIMRDTYINIPNYGQYKINSANALGGPELLRQTISENFGVDVQYYALVNFEAFSQVIDTAFPDGVEVEVEKAMEKNIGIRLEPGLQKLNGEQLLGYVRFRADAESDFGRVRRQQEVMEILTNELVSVQGVLKSPRLLGTIQPYIQTNIDNPTVLSIASSLLLSDNMEVDTLRVPVDDSFEDRRYPNAGLVLEIDVEKNKQEIQNFLSGTSVEATAEVEVNP